MNHKTRANGVPVTGVWLALALTWLLISAAAWSLPATQQPGTDSAAQALRIIGQHLAARRFDTALALAGEVDERRLDEPARAELQRMKGYAYARQGVYQRALEAYREALDISAPVEAETIMQTRYAAAQVCFALQRFDEAVGHLHAWQELENGRSGDYRPLVLLGQAYFKVREPRRALRALESGIQRADVAGAAIPEHWLRLLHHLYVEQGRWQQAVRVLERLMRLYPRDDYVELLAQARARVS